MKNKIILIVILVIIIMGLIFFLNGNDSKQLEDQALDSANQGGFAEVPVPGVDPDEFVYDSVTGSVSYSVDKKFFNQPTELVIGETSDINGQVLIDPNSQTISANLIIKTGSLDSGSSGCDDYVQDTLPQFIKVDVEDHPVNPLDGSYSGPVKAELTIGGVNRGVDFDVDIIFNDGDKIDISGSAQIMMSDFGIEPPSTLGIYEADDLVNISFDIVAQ